MFFKKKPDASKLEGESAREEIERKVGKLSATMAGGKEAGNKGRKDRAIATLLQHASTAYGRQVLRETDHGLPTLVQCLADADVEVRNEAAAVVALLSGDEPCKAVLCDCGAVPHLLRILEGRTAAARVAATTALFNLTAVHDASGAAAGDEGEGEGEGVLDGGATGGARHREHKPTAVLAATLLGGGSGNGGSLLVPLMALLPSSSASAAAISGASGASAAPAHYSVLSPSSGGGANNPAANVATQAQMATMQRNVCGVLHHVALWCNSGSTSDEGGADAGAGAGQWEQRQRMHVYKQALVKTEEPGGGVGLLPKLLYVLGSTTDVFTRTFIVGTFACLLAQDTATTPSDVAGLAINASEIAANSNRVTDGDDLDAAHQQPQHPLHYHRYQLAVFQTLVQQAAGKGSCPMASILELFQFTDRYLAQQEMELKREVVAFTAAVAMVLRQLEGQQQGQGQGPVDVAVGLLVADLRRAAVPGLLKILAAEDSGGGSSSGSSDSFIALDRLCQQGAVEALCNLSHVQGGKEAGSPHQLLLDLMRSDQCLQLLAGVVTRRTDAVGAVEHSRATPPPAPLTRENSYLGGGGSGSASGSAGAGAGAGAGPSVTYMAKVLACAIVKRMLTVGLEAEADEAACGEDEAAATFKGRLRSCGVMAALVRGVLADGPIHRVALHRSVAMVAADGGHWGHAGGAAGGMSLLDAESFHYKLPVQVDALTALWHACEECDGNKACLASISCATWMDRGGTGAGAGSMNGLAVLLCHANSCMVDDIAARSAAVYAICSLLEWKPNRVWFASKAGTPGTAVVLQKQAGAHGGDTQQSLSGGECVVYPLVALLEDISSTHCGDAEADTTATPVRSANSGTDGDPSGSASEAAPGATAHLPPPPLAAALPTDVEGDESSEAAMQAAKKRASLTPQRGHSASSALSPPRRPSSSAVSPMKARHGADRAAAGSGSSGQDMLVPSTTAPPPTPTPSEVHYRTKIVHALCSFASAVGCTGAVDDEGGAAESVAMTALQDSGCVHHIVQVLRPQITVSPEGREEVTMGTPETFVRALCALRAVIAAGEPNNRGSSPRSGSSSSNGAGPDAGHTNTNTNKDLVRSVGGVSVLVALLGCYSRTASAGPGPLATTIEDGSVFEFSTASPGAAAAGGAHAGDEDKQAARVVEDMSLSTGGGGAAEGAGAGGWVDRESCVAFGPSSPDAAMAASWPSLPTATTAYYLRGLHEQDVVVTGALQALALLVAHCPANGKAMAKAPHSMAHLMRLMGHASPLVRVLVATLLAHCLCEECNRDSVTKGGSDASVLKSLLGLLELPSGPPSTPPSAQQLLLHPTLQHTAAMAALATLATTESSWAAHDGYGGSGGLIDMFHAAGGVTVVLRLLHWYLAPTPTPTPGSSSGDGAGSPACAAVALCTSRGQPQLCAALARNIALLKAHGARVLLHLLRTHDRTHSSTAEQISTYRRCCHDVWGGVMELSTVEGGGGGNLLLRLLADPVTGAEGGTTAASPLPSSLARSVLAYRCHAAGIAAFLSASAVGGACLAGGAGGMGSAANIALLMASVEAGLAAVSAPGSAPADAPSTVAQHLTLARQMRLLRVLAVHRRAFRVLIASTTGVGVLFRIVAVMAGSQAAPRVVGACAAPLQALRAEILPSALCVLSDLALEDDLKDTFSREAAGSGSGLHLLLDLLRPAVCGEAPSEWQGDVLELLLRLMTVHADPASRTRWSSIRVARSETVAASVLAVKRAILSHTQGGGGGGTGRLLQCIHPLNVHKFDALGLREGAVGAQLAMSTTVRDVLGDAASGDDDEATLASVAAAYSNQPSEEGNALAPAGLSVAAAATVSSVLAVRIICCLVTPVGVVAGEGDASSGASLLPANCGACVAASEDCSGRAHGEGYAAQCEVADLFRSRIGDIGGVTALLAVLPVALIPAKSTVREGQEASSHSCRRHNYRSLALLVAHHSRSLHIASPCGPTPAPAPAPAPADAAAPAADTEHPCGSGGLLLDALTYDYMRIALTAVRELLAHAHAHAQKYPPDAFVAANRRRLRECGGVRRLVSLLALGVGGGGEGAGGGLTQLAGFLRPGTTTPPGPHGAESTGREGSTMGRSVVTDICVVLHCATAAASPVLALCSQREPSQLQAEEAEQLRLTCRAVAEAGAAVPLTRLLRRMGDAPLTLNEPSVGFNYAHQQHCHGLPTPAGLSDAAQQSSLCCLHSLAANTTAEGAADAGAVEALQAQMCHVGAVTLLVPLLYAGLSVGEGDVGVTEESPGVGGYNARILRRTALTLIHYLVLAPNKVVQGGFDTGRAISPSSELNWRSWEQLACHGAEAETEAEGEGEGGITGLVYLLRILSGERGRDGLPAQRASMQLLHTLVLPPPTVEETGAECARLVDAAAATVGSLRVQLRVCGGVLQLVSILGDSPDEGMKAAAVQALSSMCTEYGRGVGEQEQEQEHVLSMDAIRHGGVMQTVLQLMCTFLGGSCPYSPRLLQALLAFLGSLCALDHAQVTDKGTPQGTADAAVVANKRAVACMRTAVGGEAALSGSQVMLALLHRYGGCVASLRSSPDASAAELEDAVLLRHVLHAVVAVAERDLTTQKLLVKAAAVSVGGAPHTELVPSLLAYMRDLCVRVDTGTDSGAGTGKGKGSGSAVADKAKGGEKGGGSGLVAAELLALVFQLLGTLCGSGNSARVGSAGEGASMNGLAQDLMRQDTALLGAAAGAEGAEGDASSGGAEPSAAAASSREDSAARASASSPAPASASASEAIVPGRSGANFAILLQFLRRFDGGGAGDPTGESVLAGACALLRALYVANAANQMVLSQLGVLEFLEQRFDGTAAEGRAAAVSAQEVLHMHRVAVRVRTQRVAMAMEGERQGRFEAEVAQQLADEVSTLCAAREGDPAAAVTDWRPYTKLFQRFRAAEAEATHVGSSSFFRHYSTLLQFLYAHNTAEGEAGAVKRGFFAAEVVRVLSLTLQLDPVEFSADDAASLVKFKGLGRRAAEQEEGAVAALSGAGSASLAGSGSAPGNAPTRQSSSRKMW